MQHATCPVTGESADACAMLRLVRAPDGRVVADIAGTLPGAGVLIAPRREVLLQAWAAVAEALGEECILPDTLPEMVERALVARIQNWIALARRGGGAVCGFAKVEEGLRGDGFRLLLEAADAGASDSAKLLTWVEKSGAVASRLLTRAELGKPFGRAEAVHVLLQDAAFGAEILKELRRLAGFRQEDTL